MENSVGEDMVHQENQNRYRLRVPWKVVVDHETKPTMTNDLHDRRVHFNAEELADIFFEIYLKMFDQEDLKKSSAVMRSGQKPRNSQIFCRYSRLSYATLIQHAMSNIATEWEKFFATLLPKISADKSLHIGEQCLLELLLHLSLSGSLPNTFKVPKGLPSMYNIPFISFLLFLFKLNST